MRMALRRQRTRKSAVSAGVQIEMEQEAASLRYAINVLSETICVTAVFVAGVFVVGLHLATSCSIPMV
ncbi:uncharacterized protein PHACADRAFT_259963, partial [Phanerochaete carnosa HHB-10118-sp]